MGKCGFPCTGFPMAILVCSRGGMYVSFFTNLSLGGGLAIFAFVLVAHDIFAQTEEYALEDINGSQAPNG